MMGLDLQGLVFTRNTSESMQTALNSLLQESNISKIITTPYEYNAVNILIDNAAHLGIQVDYVTEVEILQLDDSYNSSEHIFIISHITSPWTTVHGYMSESIQEI